MLAIIYLCLASFVGYVFLKRFIPDLYKMENRWSILPWASFLTGILFTTWITYVFAYIFRNTNVPLLWANGVTFCILILFTPICLSGKNKKIIFIREFKPQISRLSMLIKSNTTEIIYMLIMAAVWSFLMFRSFYVKDGVIYTGYSVFSDFAPHLAVIRSFSFGSNFPTEYPHFADGTIRYHFMFQFLAGNLEFLGLRLDWAFNLPSILAMLSFLLLLYSFSLLLTGNKWTGILTSILFFFRSSFAFFTYLNEMLPKGNILRSILTNSEHIGNTTHEEWGLWAQKVYVNQRHLPFGLGILLLVLIIMYPLFSGMIMDVKTALYSARKSFLHQSRLTKIKSNDTTIYTIYKSISLLFFKVKYGAKEFFLNKESWIPTNWIPSLLCGILLGLISYWNGAVVVAGLSILFLMAIFSRQRLAYLITAIITVLLSLIQTRFFIPSGAAAVSPKLTIGFLSGSEKFTEILKFYIELLGILPFILLAAVFLNPKKHRLWKMIIFIPLSIYAIIAMSPAIPLSWKALLWIIVVGTYISYVYYNLKPFFKGTVCLTLAFAAPLILATTLQLTPDITVNHKYVILSVILLNIPVACLIINMFSSKKLIPAVLASLLFITLTITGFVDIVTLYNIDKNHVRINTQDPVLMWAKENTEPNEIFLTDRYSLHPLLLSGRKIFTGWPYYPWSAGYDTAMRENIARQIFGARDEEILKDLVKKNNISYIVIDNDLRKSGSYSLNEELINNCFEAVYNNAGMAIYKTNYFY